jgi:solute carrier family 26 protein
MPIIEWLPKYKWKKWLFEDFLVGFTIACIMVPQSMALAIIANLDPIFGLYSGCVASFVYTFFGTMPINSYGSSAVGAIMVGGIIEDFREQYNENDIAKAITFGCGVQFIIAFVLNFSIIITLFVPPFVSGFVTGSSIHIIVKSLVQILGLKGSDAKLGFFSLPRNIYMIGRDIQNTNIIDLITSVVVFNILMVNQLFIKPCMKRFTDIVIPTEVFVLGFASLISYLCDFPGYNVAVVGYVPQGLPHLDFPSISLVELLFLRSFYVSVLTYSTSMVVSTLFNSNVDMEQELFALGAINLICSGWECFTVGSSMMRSVIVKTLGVHSLIASFCTAVLLFIIILTVIDVLLCYILKNYSVICD